MTSYWGEFRTHWRALLAASMGLGFGIGLSAYMGGLFGPKILAEFDWSRSSFALLGSFGLLMLVMQPITGWLTDRFGVRAVSAVGVLSAPIAYIALSTMGGDIRMFFAINVLQIVFGALTTSPVYTRLVAERFERARGLAFSVVMAGPPLTGAIFAPILGGFIEDNGWRAGYQLLGAVTLAFGGIAVLLTPPHKTVPRTPEHVAERKGDYARIVANPAFWVLIGGMVLVNIPQALLSAQMKLMLMDSGASSNTATWMITIFAMGVIGGRFVCGATLDRIKAHHVAAFALGMPAIGLLLLASPLDATPMLAVAIALIGLAQGAEGDVGAYLVSRRFDLGVFSLVLALVGAAIAGGSAIGSFILSVTLHHSESYAPFLIVSAVSTLIGALLFLTLDRRRANVAALA
jgi:MFS family permease